MAGVNKVILLGNLGRDPEVSYTQSGMAVCKFSIATSKKRKDGQEVTAWHRCTAFDKRGEAIGRYVNKGQQLYVEGELQYGQYEKDGVTRYTTDIIITQFAFVGSKGSGSGGGGNQGFVQDQSDSYYSGGGGPAPVQDDDDIPF